MPIDLGECTLDRMVYARRDLTVKDLNPGHDSETVIVRKGEVGFISSTIRYYSPQTNSSYVEVCFNGVDSHWVDPEWITLTDPTFATPPKVAKLTAHIRKLEKRIEQFDETFRIQELKKEIDTLLEHADAVEHERNIYLDAFDKMGLDGLDAHQIASGEMCPECFRLMSDHGSPNVCPEDDTHDGEGNLWKDLYINDLWNRLEDAIKIHEIDYGNCEWDWADISAGLAAELRRRGISSFELAEFRNQILRENGEEDYEDDEVWEEIRNSLKEDRPMALPPKQSKSPPELKEEDIELDDNVY